jgi:hypothetical protein
VQKPFGLFDTVAIDQHSDNPDAETVHQDRDRHSRHHQQGAHPQRQMHQRGYDHAQCEQREQVAQPTAGFHDLQLVDAQVDDIALEKHADAEQPDHGHADLRGNQLQRGGQVLKQELRDRIHQQQHGQRRQRYLERRPACNGEEQAGDDNHQRIGIHRRDGGQRTDQVDGEPEQREQHAGPAAAEPGLLQFAPALPQQECTDHRHQEPVAVFLALPVGIDELQRVAEDCQHQQQQPTQKCPHQGR